MRLQIIAAAAVGLVAIGTATPSVGQAARAWQGCFVKSDLDDAARIDACTTVINASGQTKSTLFAALQVRGYLHFKARSFDLAIKDYDAAIILNPDSADGYRARASAHAANRDYARAINDFDKAIWIDPSSAMAFYFRGAVWAQKGDLDRAIVDFDQVVENENQVLDLAAQELIGLLDLLHHDRLDPRLGVESGTDLPRRHPAVARPERNRQPRRPADRQHR